MAFLSGRVGRSPFAAHPFPKMGSRALIVIKPMKMID
jgi:hypothetical protein